MKTLWNREPAAIVALVGSIIAVAVAFGADLTGEQTGAILAAVTLLLGLVTRTQVTPTGE